MFVNDRKGKNGGYWNISTFPFLKFFEKKGEREKIRGII